MNIFFGKISQKVDAQQIEQGYYVADQGTSWYGELKTDDYCYIIGGGRIQFWKAKEWVTIDGKQRLVFDILNRDLGIEIKQLVALKFFKLSVDLIVFTSRQARNQAFFRLEYLQNLTLEVINQLGDSKTYKDQSIYRNILVKESIADVKSNSEDIQLYYEEDALRLFKASFVEERVYKKFRNNLGFEGRGSVRKDNTIKKIQKVNTTYPYQVLSITSLYDAFFVEYKVRFFLVGANWSGDDQTERFIEEGVWENGYGDTKENFYKIVNQVREGSFIALKTTYRQQDKLRINARGIVLKNHKDGQTLEIEWEDEFNPFMVDFSGGYWSTIHEITKENHIKAIWKVGGQSQEIETITYKVDEPLNQILYGPPGTGKTYKLQNEYFELFTLTQESESYEQKISEEAQSLSWWKVMGLALLDLKKANVSEIEKHQAVQAKIAVSSSKTPRQSIWGQLQLHTIQESNLVNIKDRHDPLIFDKDEELNWTILIDEVKQKCPELIELHNELKSSSSTNNIQKNYQFVTFHQSFVYEDFIEGIKPQMQYEEGAEQESLTYTIEHGAFYNACLKALLLAGYQNFKQCLEDTKENRQKKFDEAPPYAVFIDEINRGNVSAIFGELITLIEESKRLGREEELTVTLPYSKTIFGVPANLYIIGTMNTADRSIEALDTALRRRFSFIEMPPKLEAITPTLAIGNDTVHLVKILKTINQRIEILLDKDHLIGHSFFIQMTNSDDLKQAFARQIIPLLQEYFYGDYGKIALVLGEGFCEATQRAKTPFAKVKGYDAGDLFNEQTLFTINNPLDMEDAELIEALQKLLNETTASNV